MFLSGLLFREAMCKIYECREIYGKQIFDKETVLKEQDEEEEKKLLKLIQFS